MKFLRPRSTGTRTRRRISAIARIPGSEVDALGFVRINIPNPYGVYMHDTPEKGVFGDDFRFVSSGCVRVQDVRDYVAWLLKDNPGWSRDQIDEVIRSGQQQNVKLAQPVPGLLGLHHRLGDAGRHSCSSGPTSTSATAQALDRWLRPFRSSRWRCRRSRGQSQLDLAQAISESVLSDFKGLRRD